jgi:putative aldouronate transport system substrate-binding protein
MFPNYRPKEFALAWGFPQDPSDPDVKPSSGRMILFYKGSQPMEAVAPPIENILPDMYYSEADIEELALLKTTIMDYINEFIARAITGKVDIDAEWDNYLNELQNLGLERYLEIIQNTYDNR